MKRWRIIILLTLGAWLMTSTPYLVGWLRQPRGGLYLATNPSSPSDTPAYYSNIEQARQGRIIFANQFTSETQVPSFFHPLWLIGGWLAAAFSLSSIIAFHVLRLVSIFVLIVVLERLSYPWFTKQRDRVLALLLVLTSSGLGWVVARRVYEGRAVLGKSIDLWVDESNTFRSMAHSALFVFSQLLVLGCLWMLYQRTRGRAIRWSWLGGAGLAILGVIHPYDIVTVASVSVVWFVAWCTSSQSRGHRLSVTRTLFLWWLWLVPVLLYYYFLPWQQLAVRGWFMQNINISPTPWAVILGFGLLIPLAIIGAVISWRDTRRPTALLVCWVGTILVMLYLPGVTIQRRFLSGLHIPLAFLSAFAIGWLLERIPSRHLARITIFCIIAILSFTNLIRLRNETNNIITPEKADYPVYLSATNNQAFAWLRVHSALNDVIMADFWTSNIMAGVIARPQVFAHPNQTVQSWDRERDWKTLCQSTTTDPQRRAIIQRLGVRWLYWTSQSAAMCDYRPTNDTMWQTVFQNNGVTIFQLQIN